MATCCGGLPTPIDYSHSGYPRCGQSQQESRLSVSRKQIDGLRLGTFGMKAKTGCGIGVIPASYSRAETPFSRSRGLELGQGLPKRRWIMTSLGTNQRLCVHLILITRQDERWGPRVSSVILCGEAHFPALSRFLVVMPASLLRAKLIRKYSTSNTITGDL